jgi:hypothetical protein
MWLTFAAASLVLWYGLFAFVIYINLLKIW